MLTSVCFPFEIRNLKFKFLKLGATAITVSDQAISAPTLSDTWGPPENLCSEVIIIECYYWNIEDHWSICWSVYLRCNLYGPEPNLSENAWSLFPFCFNVQQVKRDIGDAGCIHFLCLWGSKALRPKRDFPYLKCSKAQQPKLICLICLCLLWSGQLPSQKSQRCADFRKLQHRIQMCWDAATVADFMMATWTRSCMNEAVWFGAGFLLFRLASRCNLIPTKLEPSRFFARDSKGGALTRRILVI